MSQLPALQVIDESCEQTNHLVCSVVAQVEVIVKNISHFKATYASPTYPIAFAFIEISFATSAFDVV